MYCVLPMFSSESCIVSGLTFRCLIHFDCIFVYGVRKCSSFILLHVAVQFSQHHLLKSLFLPHCIFLPPLSKISPCTYGSHIFTKKARIYNGAKEASSINGAGNTG